MLSKGERQNVLIARALINQPSLLLLDEPGTGLDILAREQMFATVRELAEETETTLIYVSHYTEEILDIFQYCLLLKNGRVYKQGLTRDCMTSDVLSNFLQHPVNARQERGKTYLEIDVATEIVKLMKRGGGVYGQ